MKLIGSKMEKDFRKDFQRASELLFKKESKLKLALESAGYETANAQVLEWIPDQTEDTYIVLIQAKLLVAIELERFEDLPPTFEEYDLQEWSHGLSRMNQVKLLVALDLANET